MRSTAILDRCSWYGMLILSVLCSVQVVRLARAQSSPGFRFSASPIVERAAELEVQGRIEEAERELLAAADRDKRFEPAWALANFYHRQHRAAEFRTWARRAAEMSYGDRTALFELIDDERLLPATLKTDYTAFLISRGRLYDADKAISGTERNLDLTLAERFLSDKQFGQALAVWNRFREPKLDAAQPRIVPGTSGLAFDWRLGSDVTIAAESGRFEAHFNGRQKDSGELASQYLVLSPGRFYRLSFESRMAGLMAPTGLRWTVDGIAYGEELTGGPEWQSQSVTFRAEFKANPERLALTWQRAPGAAPLAGELAIRNIALEFAP